MKGKTFTPTNIERLKALEGLKLANFKQRALAIIIDIFICLLLFLIILIIAWYKATGGSFTTYTFDIFTWYGKLILNILIPMLYFGLSMYFSNGKTIGKKIIKIRVISLVNNKITFWGSIERSLGYASSLFGLGFGFIQYFIHPNRQTTHDCMAETIVIQEFNKNSNAKGDVYENPDN